jgi:hypothetical protein
MRSIAAATMIFFAMTGWAFADQCQDDVAKIDSALAGNDIDADVRAQLEGTAVTEEALALIEVQ